ncbi:MAG TPA: amidohydrolase family protein [Phycisphaerales bacterium]|nr:amidohydrolase family protein [Phycisphaerales bacterium]
MLIAGTLLLPDDRVGGSGVRLATGTVLVRDGLIVAVREGVSADKPDLGGDDALILPGFIDAHLHLPQFDSIGADGMDLLRWLDRVIYPAEARWADPDFAGAMSQRACRQLASFGTTGIAAYLTVHHEGSLAAARAVESFGLRSILGQTLTDREAPQELTRPPLQLLAETEAFLDSLRGNPRIQGAVTPRFAVACTPELLAGAGALARRKGAPVQTHLAETEAECRRVEELFNGTPYTDIYERAGLLGERTILGHGIWLDAAQRATLARTRSVIAHCPTANTFLRAGSMDRAALRRDGVRLALGSDVAGGPDRSMVRVARAMIETAKARGDTPPTAADCWRQITTGNADALGWGDTGRIAPTAWADLVVAAPDVPWRDAPDPLARLLYAWDDRWITATLAAGKIVHQRA